MCRPTLTLGLRKHPVRVGLLLKAVEEGPACRCGVRLACPVDGSGTLAAPRLAERLRDRPTRVIGGPRAPAHARTEPSPSMAEARSLHRFAMCPPLWKVPQV